MKNILLILLLSFIYSFTFDEIIYVNILEIKFLSEVFYSKLISFLSMTFIGSYIIFILKKNFSVNFFIFIFIVYFSSHLFYKERNDLFFITMKTNLFSIIIFVLINYKVYFNFIKKMFTQG